VKEDLEKNRILYGIGVVCKELNWDFEKVSELTEPQFSFILAFKAFEAELKKIPTTTEEKIKQKRRKWWNHGNSYA